MKTGAGRLLLILGMLLFALQGAIHPLFHGVGHECGASGHHRVEGDHSSGVAPELLDHAVTVVTLDCPTCGSFCFQADLPVLHAFQLPDLPFLPSPTSPETCGFRSLPAQNARAPPTTNGQLLFSFKPD